MAASHTNISVPDTVISTARFWLEGGFPTFPVLLRWNDQRRGIDKRPLRGGRGHLDATQDEDRFLELVQQAREFLVAGEEIGVGIVPGPAGFIVLDCDKKDGKPGLESLQRLIAQHGDFDRFSYRSPSGGRNVFLAKPGGMTIGNHQPAGWEGIDIRADSGWVVAPGTSCSWGAWELEYGEMADVVEIPAQMAAVLRSAAAAKPCATLVQVRDWLAHHQQPSTEAAAAALADRIDLFEAAQHGSRHQALLDISSWIVGMHHLNQAEALQLVAETWDWLTHGDGRENEPTEVLTWVIGQELGRLQEKPDGPDGKVSPVLRIEPYGDVEARVASRPSPGWLARPVFPADAHGVVGAEDKAGKTWLILDLAVAKASGGSWLGTWPTESPGRVLVFLGEGGERKMARRIEAVASAAGADRQLVRSNMRLCTQSPQLTRLDHLAAIDAELAEHKPELVILDPLYLAVGGVNGASLYEMGQHLGSIQALTQRHSAALVIVTHWNQTGSGRGRGRFTGAGPAEWGRVTMSVRVTDRRADGPKSVVGLEIEIVGDEVPDSRVAFTRTVWSTDPDDLDAPLVYGMAPGVVVEEAGARGMPECAAELRRWWTGRDDGGELSQAEVIRQFRTQQGGSRAGQWRDETIRSALRLLVHDGDLVDRQGPRRAILYRSADRPDVEPAQPSPGPDQVPDSMDTEESRPSPVEPD